MSSLVLVEICGEANINFGRQRSNFGNALVQVFVKALTNWRTWQTKPGRQPSRHAFFKQKRQEKTKAGKTSRHLVFRAKQTYIYNQKHAHADSQGCSLIHVYKVLWQALAREYIVWHM